MPLLSRARHSHEYIYGLWMKGDGVDGVQQCPATANTAGEKQQSHRPYRPSLIHSMIRVRASFHEGNGSFPWRMKGTWTQHLFEDAEFSFCENFCLGIDRLLGVEIFWEGVWKGYYCMDLREGKIFGVVNWNRYE